MNQPTLTIAQQVAVAVSAFQQQQTGHAPRAVTVVLGAETLVVTYHDALSPAEKLLARTPEGTRQVQEYHRQLFESSLDVLRTEIQRITGVSVREAAQEVELTTGAVLHVFTSGAMVQVFQMASTVPSETWQGSPSAPESPSASEGAR